MRYADAVGLDTRRGSALAWKKTTGRLTMFDEQPIYVACPQCGEQISKTIGWLKENSSFRCPAEGCGANLWFYPEELARVIKELEDRFADIRRKLHVGD